MLEDELKDVANALYFDENDEWGFNELTDKKSICSIESIFVVKKVYIDKLWFIVIKEKVPDPNDPDRFILVDLPESKYYPQIAYHMRMKGINDGAI